MHARFAPQHQTQRGEKPRQQKARQRIRIRKRPPGAERVVAMNEKPHKFMQQDSRCEQRISNTSHRKKPRLFTRQQGAAK
ncbi:MAG: hypothetical protein IPO54_05940 [Micavibrio sp.]|nr:hypothetical protein [Micavibrio sp.]